MTAGLMRSADRATIEAGTSAEVLMDRAGRAVARAAIKLAGGRYGKRAIVVCGRGSNGGDGFAAARALLREGLGVRCMLAGEPSGVSGAAAAHMRALEAAGLQVEGFAKGLASGADVVVDALFGTGFHGSPEGAAARAIDEINASGAPVVAADVPSGVDSDTGAVRGAAVRATVTVAMGAQKLGTAVPPGALRSGEVEIADIGIDVARFTGTDPLTEPPDPGAAAWVAEATDVGGWLPSRPLDAHKRSSGSVAILGGSEGMSGAVILAARAALRARAGYVTVGCTGSVARAVAETVPEAIKLVVTDSDVLGPGALERFSRALERSDALVLGPGLGRGEAQTELVEQALLELGIPVVLDADGLNALEGRLHALAARASDLERRTSLAVATPHPAEAARLLGTSIAEVQRERIAAAGRLSDELGTAVTVVLKGYRTVITDGIVTFVNPTGGPELATAGTGDVLSGVIAALIAAGLDPLRAACAGVFVHGLAGDITAAELLEGIVASDVAEAVPRAIAAVRTPLTSSPVLGS